MDLVPTRGRGPKADVICAWSLAEAVEAGELAAAHRAPVEPAVVPAAVVAQVDGPVPLQGPEALGLVPAHGAGEFG